jgi:hypothetical protein
MRTHFAAVLAAFVTATTLFAQSLPGQGPRAPRVLPGTPPEAFASVQGTALSSSNTALPNTTVRLRDGRTGAIANTQTTDKTGLFAFRRTDPGNYVVEIMAPDKVTVLAASQLLDVRAGEVVATVVRLPFGFSSLSGLAGHTGSTLTAVTAAAASSSILAATVSGAPTCAVVDGPR